MANVGDPVGQIGAGQADPPVPPVPPAAQPGQVILQFNVTV